MGRIAEFLGIEFADSLLVPTAAGLEVAANSAWPDRRVKGEIHDLSVDAWRDSLGPRAEAVVLAHTAREANAIGYPLRELDPLSRVATLSVQGAERAVRRAVRRIRSAAPS
jgi:hypothetical protein